MTGKQDPVQFIALTFFTKFYLAFKGVVWVGKQFWGMLIANTTSPTATADDPGLKWYPVRVPEPNSSFTVTWDLFAGLNFPYADLRNKPGNYYVFVRFLDGAGNASTRSIKATAILTDGYDIPTLWLPVQAR